MTSADRPKNQSPEKLLTDVRAALAAAMANLKSYELPALCNRFQLGDGTVEEANKSKATYIAKRMRGASGKRVMEIAREFSLEVDDFTLRESIQLFDENQDEPITALTRKRLSAPR